MAELRSAVDIITSERDQARGDFQNVEAKHDALAIAYKILELYKRFSEKVDFKNV